MIVSMILAAVIVVAVAIEVFIPGQPVYQSGWYNVAIAALVIVMIARTRGVFRAIVGSRARAGYVMLVIGVTVVGFSGIVSGLLAPEPRTVVGAPGTQVRLDELGGSLVFPLASGEDTVHDVSLVSPGGAPKPIGDARFTASFLLRTIARTVVHIDASDAHGAHLTITQPAGSAFLSPVLLMQAHQSIHNMDLPFDAFAVPAIHRVVRVVLFSPQQIAQFRSLSGSPRPAVLFDVEDDKGNSLPHGLALARSGEAATVDGLVLRPTIISYPAVNVIAVPSLLALGLAAIAIVLGIVLVVPALTRSTIPR